MIHVDSAKKEGGGGEERKKANLTLANSIPRVISKFISHASGCLFSDAFSIESNGRKKSRRIAARDFCAFQSDLRIIGATTANADLFAEHIRNEAAAFIGSPGVNIYPDLIRLSCLRLAEIFAIRKSRVRHDATCHVGR